MTLRRKIFMTLSILLAVAIGSLAIALSHESPCEPGAATIGDAVRMKAIMSRCYGPPSVLTLEEVAKPVPAENQILVKVHAAGVNPLDWHTMRGEPYVMRLSSGFGRPKDVTVGVDFSGTVEAVGAQVTRFKVGDAVFGGRAGALGEYVVVREAGSVATKPDSISFEQAAAVPIAAITALQALRDNGKLQPGQKVLINGASGGVGTFAVQIAKAMGAEVTGVCSTRNVELVRSLGADRVIDYTRENFTEEDVDYDLIIDNVGNQGLLKVRDVMKPGATIVMVGGQSTDVWIGPLWRWIKAAVLSPFVDEELSGIMAQLNQADLELLAGMMRDGKVTPVIDRTYALAETAEAIEYLETGRARGKVVVKVASSE